MLPFTKFGDKGPLVVMLHWLSGSAKTWTEIGEGLADRGLMCVALDLPGFGRAFDAADTGVDATVNAVLETIQSLRSGSEQPWLLAGHSMGGKLAAVVARASLDGYAGLDHLAGVMLVSPSPPGPEPMEESTRSKMLAALGESTGEADKDRKRAEDFVDDNTGKLALAADVRTRTVEDVLRMHRSAFAAWLTTGSKEDWSARVGTIALPALILAGSEEPALGPGVQKIVTAPHFLEATVVSLEGGGHLGPLERPAELVDRMEAFVANLHLPWAPASSVLPPKFEALLDSDRTSPQTRTVMKARLENDRNDAPEGPLSFDDLLVLKAMARRVLPGCPFDLASRIQAWLGLPAHDGWRHDTLPPDAEAWRVGIRSIDSAALREFSVPFFALDSVRQDELLTKAGKGELGSGLLHKLHLDHAPDHASTLFSASQTADWFGDVCGEFTKIYMADPRTMSRVGFTGFADEAGFTQIRLNEREDFER